MSILTLTFSTSHIYSLHSSIVTKFIRKSTSTSLSDKKIVMHYLYALFICIIIEINQNHRMFNLSIKLQSIASRNHAMRWNENQKTFYIKHSADRVTLYKQLIKLRSISVYQKVIKAKQVKMKNNMRNMIMNDRVKKSLHDNAFE